MEKKKILKKHTDKAKSLKLINELRKYFQVRGIARLTGISENTLYKLTAKEKVKKCTVQTELALKTFYVEFQKFKLETEYIKREITYFKTKRNNYRNFKK